MRRGRKPTLNFDWYQWRLHCKTRIPEFYLLKIWFRLVKQFLSYSQSKLEAGGCVYSIRHVYSAKYSKTLWPTSQLKLNKVLSFNGWYIWVNKAVGAPRWVRAWVSMLPLTMIVIYQIQVPLVPVFEATIHAHFPYILIVSSINPLENTHTVIFCMCFIFCTMALMRNMRITREIDGSEDRQEGSSH